MNFKFSDDVPIYLQIIEGIKPQTLGDLEQLLLGMRGDDAAADVEHGETGFRR